MKVTVRKWESPDPKTKMLDAWFLWIVGRMTGECFERIALKHGKEHWLYHPSHHGKDCPSSGNKPGIECRCDECAYFQICWPDWRDLTEKGE